MLCNLLLITEIYYQKWVNLVTVKPFGSEYQISQYSVEIEWKKTNSFRAFHFQYNFQTSHVTYGTYISLWHHPLTIVFLPTISEDFQSKIYCRLWAYCELLLSVVVAIVVVVDVVVFYCFCRCCCCCCCCCHCTTLMFIICCPLNIDFLSLLLTHGHKHGYSTTAQHTFIVCFVCSTALYFGNSCCNIWCKCRQYFIQVIQVRKRENTKEILWK